MYLRSPGAGLWEMDLNTWDWGYVGLSIPEMFQEGHLTFHQLWVAHGLLILHRMLSYDTLLRLEFLKSLYVSVTSSVGTEFKAYGGDSNPSHLDEAQQSSLCFLKPPGEASAQLKFPELRSRTLDTGAVPVGPGGKLLGSGLPVGPILGWKKNLD